MDKEKYDSWMIAPELWKEAAAVSNFMRDEIKKGLRDANGDPLPATINEFFLDLLFQRVKPRKGGMFMPSVKDCIREQYTELLFIEQMTGTHKRLRIKETTGTSKKRRGGLSTSESSRPLRRNNPSHCENTEDHTLSASERVKKTLADRFDATPATIDQTVSLRDSRKRKPRKRLPKS